MHEDGQAERATAQGSPRPIFTPIVLFTLGVMVGYMLAQPRIMWPEIILVVTVAVLLLRVPRQEPVPLVDWRPWRRPQPFRSTVSGVLLLVAAVPLVFDWIHSGSVWTFPIWMTLMFAVAVVQPGLSPGTRRGRVMVWALRGLWGLMAIDTWWSAYRSLGRVG